MITVGTVSDRTCAPTVPLRTAPAAAFVVAVTPGTEVESPGCRHRGGALNPRPLGGAAAYDGP